MGAIGREIIQTTLGTSPYLRWVLVTHGPWEDPAVQWMGVIAPLLTRGCFSRHMRPEVEWGTLHLDWAVRVYLTGRMMDLPLVERIRTWSAATWDSFEPDYEWAVGYLRHHALGIQWTGW